MQTYRLQQDVKVVCEEATSFPKGIKGAFDTLSHKINMEDRQVFGISNPYKGMIRYRAAATESFDGEGAELGFPTFTIERGNYLGETLLNWQSNEMMIMSIFNRLVADKRLAGSAHCIEWYKSHTELLCMVLMKPDVDAGLAIDITL
ncbi:hypothetical protein [Mucilaginibacter myungsuensis]|uniref:Uncharacterized protein n=1 Tax=Mucilaginibacter myungsuensis TaxID=649104 RepID=A0A929KZD2_9SPHI|nr:hypothetical protein [Mucilaginibacter myungsuensis]MBE9663987.1 hypothetical protein [Mucilaginibacter myungsuensis]MDN3601166.1 hypothetical protein [Mucilaginibacter myungsuensis]